MEGLLNILNGDLSALVFLGLIMLGVILAGYYFLFIRKPSTPAWKEKVSDKYRVLQVQEKNRDRKLVVIDADKLLEYALQQKYGQKVSLGSLLKTKGKIFAKDALNDIWSAHKLRNKLVHDIEYEPSPNELNFAVIVLKKAIKALIEE